MREVHGADHRSHSIAASKRRPLAPAGIDVDQPSSLREVYRAHDASAFEVSFFL
jgi:hypothetical protein